MKVTATQYAKTLYELTKDKNQDQIRGIVSDFAKILEKNGQLKLKSDIMNRFGEIYNKENGVVEAEVISREELNEELRSKLRSWVSIKYGAKEVVINNRIDASIVGGVVIKVGDEVVDGSVNRQLINLKNRLIH